MSDGFRVGPSNATVTALLKSVADNGRLVTQASIRVPNAPAISSGAASSNSRKYTDWREWFGRRGSAADMPDRTVGRAEARIQTSQRRSWSIAATRRLKSADLSSRTSRIDKNVAASFGGASMQQQKYQSASIPFSCVGRHSMARGRD